MSDAELLDLEYAALMHDIGQLSLTEPIPGGATVVAAPTEQRRHRRARRRGHPADRCARRRSPRSSSSRPSRTAGPTTSDVRTCRWAAASSRPSTPTTTWSASRTRPAHGSTHSNDCGSGWPTSTTPPSWSRCRAPSTRTARLGVEPVAAPPVSEQQPDAGRDQHVPRADHLRPPRQRHRDVSPAERPAGCPARPRSRIGSCARCRSPTAMPARAAARPGHRHRDVEPDDDDVEQQARGR